MRIANLISSLMVLALAGAVFTMTLSFPDLQGSETGPAFFPRLLSGLLGILGIVLLFQSLRDRSSKPDGPLLGVIMVIALMFVYLLLFTWIGFLISTPIVVLAFLLYVKVKKWSSLIALPAGVTLFIYLLFVKFLGVPLPIGELFG